MKIEVSTGEIFDKWTILQIKSEKITDPEKKLNITREYNMLTDVVNEILNDNQKLFGILTDAYKELKRINETLWKVEDEIRYLEFRKDFSDEFIDLARMVYTVNDKRAEVKKRINQLTRSKYTEEKSYTEY